MNPLISLSVLYFFMTVGSASVLYFSFKEQIDTSGKFFLLAEVVTIPMVVLFALINTNATYQQPAIFFLSNLLGLCAEVAILFSIHALTREVRIHKFLALMFLSAIYCLFMEYCRIAIDPNLPTFLYALASFGLALSTYAAYKSSIDIDIRENLFLRWIAVIEIGLAIFALTRIASYFLGASIKPHGPTAFIATFYALYVGLCIFRYVAYQSLRISWVDPRSQKPNILNRNLAKAIEEKDQLLRGLISSNRAIGISSLASSLAHQLSQPLTSIAIQTETVTRDLVEAQQNPAQVRLLEKISDQLGKLSDLVNNLRQLFSSRNEQFHSVNLEQAANEILELIEPSLKSKNIKMAKSFQLNPLVYGDKIQLQQVLINLLNNAIDAITESNSPSKEIRLSISQNADFAILAIEDSGDGLIPELQHSLFDLYKTTKKEGLGVGLWLSKTIMDKHHGSITASNGVNGGAVFKIQIPLAREGSLQS